MSTPAIASRDANVWRRSYQEKSVIRARWSAGRKTRLMKFCESRGVLGVDEVAAELLPTKSWPACEDSCRRKDRRYGRRRCERCAGARGECAHRYGLGDSGLGCWRHRDRRVFALGGVGVGVLLVTVALGRIEAWERVGTIRGSGLVMLDHVRNY
jgi:hypothetical protein